MEQPKEEEEEVSYMGVSYMWIVLCLLIINLFPNSRPKKSGASLVVTPQLKCTLRQCQGHMTNK